MKNQILLAFLVSGAIMLTGCGKNPEDCQQAYNTAKEKSVKKYEDCSREKCTNRVVALGSDACANDCTEAFKKEAADQDANLAECLAKSKPAS